MTDEEIATVARLRQSSLTMEDIARLMKRGRPTIKATLKKLGLAEFERHFVNVTVALAPRHAAELRRAADRRGMPAEILAARIVEAILTKGSITHAIREDFTVNDPARSEGNAICSGAP